MKATPTDTSQIASTADAPPKGETKPVVVVSLVVLVVLAAFAIFVWPTRYRYEHTYNQVLVRIDRFTDEVSYLDLAKEGWQTLKPEERNATFTLPEASPSRTLYQAQLPDASPDNSTEKATIQLPPASVTLQEILPFSKGSVQNNSDTRNKCKRWMGGDVVGVRGNAGRPLNEVMFLTQEDIAVFLPMAQETCKKLYGEKGY